jgi:Vacuolar sorting protein 9 (VPS9) domain
LKRQLWEEEIEKRVTRQMYDRIFQPKTSDDAERDLKLQGKIKALVVVGVTLPHLGVELTDKEKEMLQPAIETVGRELYRLDEVKSPREKLNVLLAVHKVLVDGLTFPSEDGTTGAQSSADLLLPVLIYR